jgi:outer membrane protein assembly factor BamB
MALSLTATALALAACTSGSTSTAAPRTPGTHAPATPASRTASPRPATGPPDWPTYHGRNDRAGDAAAGALRPPLRRAWTRRLDGAVYAQPLVVGGLVIAATENNTVYALDAAHGRIRWHRHLGAPVSAAHLPCGNIDPLGITGTPAYDATTADIFVVTETAGGRHTLVALAASNGRPRWHRNLDVMSGRDPSAQQQRSALLVAHGHVYVAFGGLYGDCGNYVGYITGVATDGRGPTLRYAVPTAREAGMWAAAGPVTGPQGDIYVATGNGAQTGGNYDGSDSVIRLTPQLHRVGFFAPTTWASDNAQDLDLGSAAPVPLRGHIVVAGKRGTVYLLPPRLGGIGGQVSTLSGCPAYGGAASAGLQVFLPCSDGLRRLDVTGNHMRWRWSIPGLAGSPALARNVLYALDQNAGDLVMVVTRTGHVRARIQVGKVTRFATPVPFGTRVFVGTTSGVVAVRGRA